MAVSLRKLFCGFLLPVFVQPLFGLRYLTLPPWMSVNSAKDAGPILKGNGTRPVDCIILALEANLSPKPSFFYFEPANGRCAIFSALQGYTMYGYAGRSYFVLGDNFYTGPGDVCPSITTLIYGMMNLAYSTHTCLQNPAPFTQMADGTNRCRLTAKQRPAVGAYYAGFRETSAVSPALSDFYSLNKDQVRAGQSISCGSPVASVAYGYTNSSYKPYCYAYFAYPNGTSLQATCDRKYPGSVVQLLNVNYSIPQYGVNFGYFAYLPAPGSKTADYVFYEGTGPETDIVTYPFVQCSKSPS